LIAIGVALLVSVIAAALALRRTVTKPVEELTGSSREVAGGELSRSLLIDGPLEIAELGRDVDAMRQRLVRELEASHAAQVQLGETASDLVRSNAELEQFAYVASHDLQEPLRKVTSFCQLLHDRYGGQLDERADQYIEFAVDGAKRMQTLINDLLAFSRVGRLHQEYTEVELERVLAAAADSLSVAVGESGAVVTHDPLPTVVGNATQLGVLFQNLLANAVKFRSPERPPRIHVEAVRDGDSWSFAVRDNGIGIEPEYAERVFVIFQRLHTRDAYPGNGIGLAMCKKIVEFHGGVIAVDPDYTGGTRVSFTLPAGIRLPR
jgi:light-regulated signal transduction histidine kinase (bacteriophytochrome)